ncbi:hypothetical protein AMTRI_Chr11g99790 [Amborella trichopoda]
MQCFHLENVRKASSLVSFTPNWLENPTSSEILATMAARKRGGFKIAAPSCNFRPRRSNGFFRLKVFRSLKEKMWRALCWVQKKKKKLKPLKDELKLALILIPLSRERECREKQIVL